MLTETVIATKVVDTHIWVQSTLSSSCNACSAKPGCGQSLYAKFFAQHRQLRVARTTDIVVVPGDRLIIGLSESAILSGSALIYLLPILGLIVGSIIGNMLTSSEFAVFVIAMLSLVISAWGVSFYTKNVINDGRFEPVLIKKLDNV